MYNVTHTHILQLATYIIIIIIAMAGPVDVAVSTSDLDAC